MGVPLIQNEQILGMLSISRLTVAPFTPDEVESSATFAGQAAIALGNAHLFAETHKFNMQLEEQSKRLQTAVDDLNHANLTLIRRTRQLETSNQIGQQITSILEIKQLLPKVIHIIQSQFNYSWVSIWLMNESRDMLILETCTNSYIGQGIVLKTDHKGITMKAYCTGEMVYVDNLAKNNTFAPTPGLSLAFSEISYPLKFQKDVMGILDIQSERMNAFNPEDISVLQTVASQLAIALRNAKLHSDFTQLNKAL